MVNYLRDAQCSVVRASNWYLEGHGFDSRWGLRSSFSEYFDLRTLLHYLHFIQVTNHLSFIRISHFNTLSLAQWQDTCHTYENLVYNLAHNESPIAQWLKRATDIWKVMCSTHIGGSEILFLSIFT